MRLNKQAIKLMNEINFIDRDTLELKKELQYKGCPFCEIDDGEFIETHQTKQALFFKFKKCNCCSLVYPYPRPNKDLIENHFKAVDYSRFSEELLKNLDKEDKIREERKRNSFPLARIARNIWEKNSPLCYSYQEFNRFAKKGFRILDVGAGFGNVAEHLLKKGCIVEAVEPNLFRAKYLREKRRIKVYESTFERAKFEEGKYDMIIFSNVFMHLFSIKETIQKAKRVLRPGGSIVSSQMNFNSIIQKTIRSPYPGKGLTPFKISCWFTPESLKTILEKSGFSITAVKFRPTHLFDYLFVEGYPGGHLASLLLKIMDKILTVILMRTRTSDYFAIVARKAD